MASFQKKYRIKTNARQFFNALTDEVKVRVWSGAPAIMDAMEGSEFSLWSESIVGINKSVTDHKLIQLWKEKSWPHYSLVTFSWHEEGEYLSVLLTHKDIPGESYKNIARGWDDHYMNPLTTWLESNNF